MENVFVTYAEVESKIIARATGLTLFNKELTGGLSDME